MRDDLRMTANAVFQQLIWHCLAGQGSQNDMPFTASIYVQIMPPYPQAMPGIKANQGQSSSLRPLWSRR
jgi:hypothetical protein